jgi:hypothetical protein
MVDAEGGFLQKSPQRRIFDSMRPSKLPVDAQHAFRFVYIVSSQLRRKK